MPYNPGVQDISGQIRAQGRVAMAQGIGQGISDFTRNYAQSQEENAKFNAKSKSLENMVKTHAELFGLSDPEKLKQALEINPRETPVAKYERLSSMVESSIMASNLKKMEDARKNDEMERQIKQAALAQQGIMNPMQAEAMRLQLEAAQRQAAQQAELDRQRALVGQAASGVGGGVLSAGVQDNPFFKAAVQARQAGQNLSGNDLVDYVTKTEALKAKPAGTKAPEGYEAFVNPNTGRQELRAIPGGPGALAEEAKKQDIAAQKKKEEDAQEKLKARAESAKERLDIALTTIDQAIGLAEKGAGGPMDAPASVVFRGSDTRKLANKLATIKSVLALQNMQELKELSASGATGFGSLTAPELAILQDSVAKLNEWDSEEIIKENLSAIKEVFERARARKSAPQSGEQKPPAKMIVLPPDSNQEPLVIGRISPIR